MNELKEHDAVVLLRNIDEYGLREGDVGTIVHIYHAGSAMEIEFVTGEGKTVAVITLKKDDVRPLGERDILHAREMAV